MAKARGRSVDAGLGDGSVVVRLAPTPAVSSAEARVLIALIRVHRAHGRATTREVALAAGRSISTTYTTLQRLRAEDLCTWDEGPGGAIDGSLRPLVEAVPFGVKRR